MEDFMNDDRPLEKMFMEVVRKNRGMFMFEAVIFVLLGIFALAAPVAFSLGLELLLGWVFIVAGIVQGIRSFQAYKSPNLFLSILGAILYLGVGVIMLRYPLSGLMTLGLLIASLFFLDGAFKISFSLQLRPASRWGWVFFSGILSLILAVLILGSFPTSATWILGVLVGVNLLFTGITQLFITMAAD